MTQDFLAVTSCRPTFLIPLVVDDANDIDESAGLHRVVHEMRLMAKPQVHKRLAKLSRHRVGWNKRAPGRTVTECWLRSSQSRGNRRPNAIGTDQSDASFIEYLRAAPAKHGHAIDVRREFFEPGTKFELDVKLVMDCIRE